MLSTTRQHSLVRYNRYHRNLYQARFCLEQSRKATGQQWKDATTEGAKQTFFSQNYKGLPAEQTAGNFGKSDTANQAFYKGTNPSLSNTNNQLNYRSNGQTMRVGLPSH